MGFDPVISIERHLSEDVLDMSVTITINGDLILDQTTGIQLDNNDVPVDVTTVGGPGNDILTGSLDSDFLNFLNALSPTLQRPPEHGR